MTPYTITFKGKEPMQVISVFTNKTAVNASYMKNIQLGTVNRELMQIFFAPMSTDWEELLSIYSDEETLSEITLTDPNTGNFWVHLDYVIPVGLSLKPIENPADIEVYGMSHWFVMELAQLTPIDKELHKLVGKSSHDKSFMETNEYKDYLIEKSKTNLADYLEHNVMEFNGEYFKVTQSKQSQFMNAYNAFVAKYNAGDKTTKMVWAATGEVEGKERTATWCVEFMKAIDAFVQPLVNKQRVFETTVVGCKTKQELDALTIPFTE